MATEEIESKVTEPIESVVSEQTNIDEDKISKLIDSKIEELNSKYASIIDDITKKNESEMNKLKEQLAEKEKEVQKQKDITAKIVLNSSIGRNSDEVDFTTADFDSINWDKQASKYMKKIDEKLM